MMALARLQRFGHTPIALAGGGTGLVGDPGGRTSERPLLPWPEVEANVESIKTQLARILDFEARGNPARIINNADWLVEMRLMDFLRDVGKHFTVNTMMAKESVRLRLEREDGVSFTEFSYMLLQAYDFLHLFDRFNCVMQAGGSDQWGNITAGVELVRRVRGQRPYGLVYPLLNKADGTKIGKTTGGAVWLDPQRTSPYRFYQFWLNTEDAQVIQFLKLFTWLEQAEICALEEALRQRPEQREAQHTLARAVTRIVHGETAVAKAEQAASVLFGGEFDGLSAADIQDIFADVPSSQVPRSHFEGEGIPIVDLLITTELASSKGEARRAIQGGGIYLNNRRVSDQEQRVLLAQSIEGQFLVLRGGRKQYHLVHVT
jgi:tyrosyl-tRNA synthetase